MRTVSKQKAAAVVLGIAAVLLVMGIWPLRLFTRDHSMGMDASPAAFAEPVDTGEGVGEFFLAQGTHLKTLSFYLKGTENSTGTADAEFLLYRIEDNGGVTLIARERVLLPEQDGWVSAGMDVDTEPGRQYIAAVTSGLLAQDSWGGMETGGTPVIAGLETPSEQNSSWLQYAFYHTFGEGADPAVYDGTEDVNSGIPGYFVMTAVTYAEPLGVRGSLLAAAAVLLLCAGIYFVLKKSLFRPRNGQAPRTTVRRVCQTVFAPCILAAGVLGIWAVARGMFDFRWTDNALYIAGILVLMAAGFYALYGTDPRLNPQKGAVKAGSLHAAGGMAVEDDAGLSYVGGTGGCRLTAADAADRQTRISDLLQTVFTAVTLAFCCDYMNGLYDINHRVSEREMAFFFLLIVLSTFRARELRNRGTLVSGVVSAAAGCLYLVRHWSGPNEAGEGASLENHALVFGVLTAAAFAVTLTNVIRQIMAGRVAGGVGAPAETRTAGRHPHSGTPTGAPRRGSSAGTYPGGKAAARVSRLFAVVLAVFALWIVIFRNTRLWPVTLAVFGLLLYLRFITWEERGRLLTNFTNGIVLQFVVTVIWCLLRRYFLAFIYIRFPMQFHTVTVTAEYLTMVEAAALSRLLQKWRSLEGRRFAERAAGLFPEAAFFTAATEYLIFTMSRTGVLAAAVTALVLLIAFGVRRRGTGHYFAAGKAGAAVLAMVLMTAVGFPALFTAQRIIPTVVGRPFTFDGVEHYTWDDIARGRHWDSINWVCIERFRMEFNFKMLGIEGGEYDPYAQKREYEERKQQKESARGGALVCGQEDILALSADAGLLEHGTADTAVMENATSDAAAAADQTSADITVSGEADAAAVVSEDVTADAAASGRDPSESDYTNGRLDIWRSYLTALNLTGHDTMGTTLHGKTMVHAHNTFLQAAYDFGIPGGLLLLLVLLWTFVRGIRFCRANPDNRDCMVPMALTVGYTMAGMVEWLFEVSNPCTMMMLLVIAPLLVSSDSGQKKTVEK